MTDADDSAPDTAPGCPPPRAQRALWGHRAAAAELAAAARGPRLHHAWLFAGPRGVGKATLAYRFARWLLAGRPDAPKDAAPMALPPMALPETPAAARVAAQVAARSHPDLAALHRGWDSDKKRLRRDITVNDVRAATAFMEMTGGGARLCVVDAVDDLNTAGANALLKGLEEPAPGVVYLLIAHRPGRVLATIRSRCRLLRLAPIARDAALAGLAVLRPEADAATAAAALDLAGGAIGRAVEFIDIDGPALAATLAAVARASGGRDDAALHELAERLARPGADAAYNAFHELARGLAHDRARMAAGEGGAVDPWLSLWEKLRDLADAAERINLDRRQVALDALFAIRAAAQAQIVNAN